MPRNNTSIPKSRPKKSNPTQKKQPCFNTENLFKMMNCLASPPAKTAVVNNVNSQLDLEKNPLLLSPSQFTLSSPQKGPLTNHVTTPKGSKLSPTHLIKCENGVISIFLSEDKASQEELAIAPTPASEINQSMVPDESLAGMMDIQITHENIEKIKAQISQRKAACKNIRGQSQNQIMKMTARGALQKAGVSVEARTVNWTHLVSYTFIGDEGQCVKNIGLATQRANAANELFNGAIKSLVKTINKPLYLSVVPEWVPGYEKIRLLKTLTYTVKDGLGVHCQHTASLTFNMLSLRRICAAEIKLINQIICKSFQEVADGTDVAHELHSSSTSTKHNKGQFTPHFHHLVNSSSTSAIENGSNAETQVLARKLFN